MKTKQLIKEFLKRIVLNLRFITSQVSWLVEAEYDLDGSFKLVEAEYDLDGSFEPVEAEYDLDGSFKLVEAEYNCQHVTSKT